VKEHLLPSPGDSHPLSTEADHLRPDPCATYHETAEILECLFGQYLTQIQPGGLVDEVLVGYRERDQATYIWNVLSIEFSSDLGEHDIQLFDQLNQAVYEFLSKVPDTASIRVAHINPSQRDNFSDACVENAIDVYGMRVQPLDQANPALTQA